MKFIALIAASLFMLSACTGSIVPISGTPTADKILSNARRAARDLDSYRATITTTVTTHYPQTSIREVTGYHVHTVEVGAPTRYRMLSQTRDFEFVSLQGDTYFKADGNA